MTTPEKPGIAASNRDSIDITQQIEYDLFPIRGNIKIHPGAFLRTERDLLIRPGRIVHIPFGFILGEYSCRTQQDQS
jgi:hypothetical protein